MTVVIQAVRGALNQFRQSLEQSSTHGREALFHGRDQLRYVSGALEASQCSNLLPLVESMQLFLESLLRNGELDIEACAEVLTSLAGTLESLTCTSGAIAANPLAASYLGVDGRSTTGTILRKDGHLHAGSGETIRLPDYFDEPAAVSSPATPRPTESDATLDKSAITRLLSDREQVSESRLGQVLLRDHCINTDQLDRALTVQKITRRKLGEVLVAMELIGVETLNHALGKQRQQGLNLVGDHAPANRALPKDQAHLRMLGSDE